MGGGEGVRWWVWCSSWLAEGGGRGIFDPAKDANGRATRVFLGMGGEG